MSIGEYIDKNTSEGVNTDEFNYYNIVKELKTNKVIVINTLEDLLTNDYRELLFPLYKLYLSRKVINSQQKLVATIRKNVNVYNTAAKVETPQTILCLGISNKDKTVEVKEENKFLFIPSYMKEVGLLVKGINNICDFTVKFGDSNSHTKSTFYMQRLLTKTESGHTVKNIPLCKILEYYFIIIIEKAIQALEIGKPIHTISFYIDDKKLSNLPDIVQLHTNLLNIAEESSNTIEKLKRQLQSVIINARLCSHNIGKQEILEFKRNTLLNELNQLKTEYVQIVDWLDTQS